MQVLDYRRATRPIPPWLRGYTYLMFGCTGLSLAALLYGFITRDNSIVVLPAFASPVLAVICSLQYRGIFHANHRLGTTAGVLQMIVAAGMLYVSIAATAEARSSVVAVDLRFYAAFVGFGLLAAIPAIGGWGTYKWSTDVWRDEHK